MNMPWHRSDPRGLGRELRANRPKPRADFETKLEQDIVEERRHTQSRRHLVPSFRLGLAAGTTTLLLVSFAAAGGMAAASSSVRSALTDVARVVHIAAPAHPARVDKGTSPAQDQYGRKKKCGKQASDREDAAIRAANAKLKRDLALANKHYAQSVAMAKKRYTSSLKTKAELAREHAALSAAQATLKRERGLAYKQHRQLVTNAKDRYKSDKKKCPKT
jgi:hypothetical protein